jgi:hypothetical protein
VALHAWYDFTLFLASYSLSKTISRGDTSFVFSFPF